LFLLCIFLEKIGTRMARVIAAAFHQEQKKHGFSAFSG
jgi:hypothetical protein